MKPAARPSPYHLSSRAASISALKHSLMDCGPISETSEDEAVIVAPRRTRWQEGGTPGDWKTWRQNGWGGPEWEADNVNAQPRKVKKSAKPRVIVQPVAADSDKENYEEEEEVVIKEATKLDEVGRFGRVELIRFVNVEGDDSWIPYVPAPEAPKVPKTFEVDDPNDPCLFVLESRRTHPKDNPELFIAVKSPVLVNVLRSMSGFPGMFLKRSSVPLTATFPKLRELKASLAALEEIAKVELVDDDVRADARSYGVMHALDPDFSDENVLKALLRAERELREFVCCVDTEFEPTRQLIALYKEHDQVLFEHLMYTFEPGQELVFHDAQGDSVCIRVKKTEYGNYQPRSFTVSGDGYRWAGGAESVRPSRLGQEGWGDYAVFEEEGSGDDAAVNGLYRATKPSSSSGWRVDQRECFVRAWEGPRTIDSLPFRALSEDMKLKLQERGRVYAKYATKIHYVHNAWSRADLLPVGRTMVDVNSGRLAPSGDPPEALDEERLHLLPSTVTGFSLTSKIFGVVHVLALESVTFDGNAWNHLVLDPDSKTLIKSLVEVTQVSQGPSPLINDVITGKGGGLIGVLHGPPGTGKTLTAEAVAEHLKRPLYMISAGELSLSASKLESDLKKLLTRATNWDAVMLIDEADVFLEQRSHHELQRNSVVSVTLKLFEYHQGVLFLTTNRITAFDEAFLSRFSIAIRYPDLDVHKRRTVWRKFLDLAGATREPEEGKPYVSPDDIEKLASRPFNGRTVKNLVRTAQALALAQKEPLSMRHLEVVARVSERFLSDFKVLTEAGVQVQGSKSVQFADSGLDSAHDL